MLLMIDNYDSFTYNLVHYFAVLGAEIIVRRNNQITLAEISALQPRHIVISPGPCSPNEAGISLDVIQHFAGKIPILGVCLGHQAIVQSFGGKVIHAQTIMHGKTSAVYHKHTGIFKDLPLPLQAGRYHSLAADKTCLPECLEVTAWTQTAEENIEEIMGVKHVNLPVEGVQFHPESILTETGHQLLNNFLTAYS